MHIPVLLHEIIEILNPKNDEIIVDATINGGGHTEAILKKEDFNGQVIGIDQDKIIAGNVRYKLKKYIDNRRLVVKCGNFKDIDNILGSLNIKKINAILFDLGMSSLQISESGRGFSFLKDEPLIMSYKAELSLNDITAEKIINEWSGDEIYQIIKEYGEERFVKRITKNILEERRKKRIKTTRELAEIIGRSIPVKKSKIHPATKTFQALRIAVNNELVVLKKGIEKAFPFLNSGGRMAVISFHSLEDRIVKNFFRDLKREGKAEILTKKPIIASEKEKKENPRARSAKLRGIIKI